MGKPNYTRFEEDIHVGQSLEIPNSHMLLYFSTRASQRDLGLKIDAKFRTLSPL